MFGEGIVLLFEMLFAAIGITGEHSKFSSLTNSLGQFNGQLFDWSKLISQNVMMPVATIILALFALLELHRQAMRMDSVGAQSIPAEIIFKVLFRFVIAKMALEMIPVIMEAIYSMTTYLTTQMGALMFSDGMSVVLDSQAVAANVNELGFGMQLVTLIFTLIVYLITVLAMILAEIIVTVRFIEIYVYFAISPLPAATFLSDEHSGIGKSFLKSFAAVCLQGTLIFMVLSFLPVLFAGAISGGGDGDVMAALISALMYSIVVLFAIMATGRWSKTIMGTG